MPEESTTPDLVELVQRSWEPMASLDVDGIMSFYAPDAVYDFSPIGMGVFRGRAAIREFVEDWLSSYDRIDWRLEHVANLGNGVTISVTVQKAQLAGSRSRTIAVRYVAVHVWVDGLIANLTNYRNIDEARAVAERLAESRR